MGIFNVSMCLASRSSPLPPPLLLPLMTQPPPHLPCDSLACHYRCILFCLSIKCWGSPGYAWPPSLLSLLFALELHPCPLLTDASTPDFLEQHILVSVTHMTSSLGCLRPNLFRTKRIPPPPQLVLLFYSWSQERVPHTGNGEQSSTSSSVHLYYLTPLAQASSLTWITAVAFYLMPLRLGHRHEAWPQA